MPSQNRSFFAVSATLFMGVVTVAACSKGKETIIPGGYVACTNDKQCAPGLRCVVGYKSADEEAASSAKSEVAACRLTCDLDPNNPADIDANGNAVRSAQDKCPNNYHCAGGGTATDKSTVSYCVPNRATANFPPAKGQWGTSCNPADGYDHNPACDADNSFWCYGDSPTDGSAICTQFQCTDDFDCAGGYWCATTNVEPSSTAAARTPQAAGKTTTVCLPRAWNLWQGSYCAPCKNDADCPLNDGKLQHCVGADGNGGDEKICAAECTVQKSPALPDSDCNLDGKCADATELTDVKVCLPRASTCLGDGSFCSPCRSDADCTNGLCATGDYTTERFCTQKSTTACSGTPTCPAKLAGDLGVSCETAGALKDQCVGLVQFSKDESTGAPSPAAGCWTVARTK